MVGKLPRGRWPVPLEPQPRPPEREADVAWRRRTKVGDGRAAKQGVSDGLGAVRVLRNVRESRRASVLPNRDEGLARVTQRGGEQQQRRAARGDLVGHVPLPVGRADRSS